MQLGVVDDAGVLACRGAEGSVEARVRLLSLVARGVAAERQGRGDERQDEQHECACKAQPQAKRA